MLDFRDKSIKELEEFFEEIGEKKFRAKQMFSWIHKGEDIDAMSVFSNKLRERLKEEGYVNNMSILHKYVSKIDGTIKYIMSLKDENIIECVLMKYSYGNTICISSQVGCRQGCAFCASALGGKVRDLTAGEMLGQILTVFKDTGMKISNVVIMGIGEPLDNFSNFIKFIELVNNSEGINIGMRNITVSTCGLVPEIIKLADMKLQLTLAISLHAPNDEIRKNIMPIALKYSYNELMDACRYYINITNKRITFEYALIDGINDSEENAKELGKNLKGMLTHVNLIPLNNVDERSYKKSNWNRVEGFKSILEGLGIDTTVRRELGSDINAACGQLRRKHQDMIKSGVVL